MSGLSITPASCILSRKSDKAANSLAFVGLLPQTKGSPRLDRRYCVADALLSDPLFDELVNGHHMQAAIWKSLRLCGVREGRAWFVSLCSGASFGTRADKWLSPKNISVSKRPYKTKRKSSLF